MKSAILSASVAAVAGQGAGTLTHEKHPTLSVWECSAPGSCSEQKRTITIDSNWRWTHKTGEATNCYTGNEWDQGICPDAKTCTQNCEIDGADKEYEGTYGIFTTQKDLTMKFVTEGPYSTNVGSRTYLLDQDDETYQMFHLANKEFSFDVNVSNLPCGLNGALYFVSMDKDGGKSKFSTNAAGSKYGTGYCDAQCPHDLKWINGEANIIDWVPSKTDKNAGFGKYGTCCTEVDLWEANSMSQAYTMHSCTVDEQTRCDGVDCGDNPDHRFDGVCDKNGCDYATYRLENYQFYGPGSEFQIDTTEPFTVTTQFVTSDGTDSGEIVEARRVYSQKGKTIVNPSSTLQGKKHDSITNDFCSDWVATTKDGSNFMQKGDMKSVDIGFKKGMVLVLSMWDDHEANMLWLDSTYPVDGSGPGVKRGTCATTSGDPKDVEKNYPHSSVTYSNIKYGPIGSTTGGAGSCTAENADPWSTGKFVDCCAGTQSTLVHDATWHYKCLKPTMQV